METILFALAGVFLLIILVVLLLPTKKEKATKTLFEFVLTAGKRRILFRDPFDNFLVYGGANSGKTKFIGKPILEQYIKSGFAGFIYDYKDFNLTTDRKSVV